MSPGSSAGIVSRNIEEMVRSGHPHAQAVAAALSNADRHPRRADGGALPAYQFGGASAQMPPHLQLGPQTTTGFLKSATPGRTDHLRINAPAGAYVIPADLVSGIGEGNSNAGAAILERALTTGPGGIALPLKPKHNAMSPRGPTPPTKPHIPFAKGGKTADGEAQPILAAGGEYIVPPDVVRLWGRGDTKRGHDMLDRWVVTERAKMAAKQAKLPGPKK